MTTDHALEELAKHREAIQPLLDQGWTPAELIWLAQRKLHRHVLGEHQGGVFALADPTTARLSRCLQILRQMFPGVEAAEPKGKKGG
jgi:hypothetical protein